MISNQFIIFHLKSSGNEVGINLSNISEIDFANSSFETLSAKKIDVQETAQEIKNKLIEIQALDNVLNEYKPM